MMWSKYNVILFHCFSYHHRLSGVTRWALTKTTTAVCLIVMNKVTATNIPTWSTYTRSSCYEALNRVCRSWPWSLEMLIMVAHIFFQAMVAIYGSCSGRLRIDRISLNRTPFHASLFKKKERKNYFHVT